MNWYIQSYSDGSFNIDRQPYSETIPCWVDKMQSWVWGFDFQWGFKPHRINYVKTMAKDLKFAWGGWKKGNNSLEFLSIRKFAKLMNGSCDSIESIGNRKHDMYRGFNDLILGKNVPHFIDGLRLNYIPFDEYFQSDFRSYFNTVNRNSGGFIKNMDFWLYLTEGVQGFQETKQRKNIQRIKLIEKSLVENPQIIAVAYFKKFAVHSAIFNK